MSPSDRARPIPRSKTNEGIPVPDDLHASSATEDQTAQAYRTIRRMIVDGGLPPGHRMSHRVLAEQLGLGRSPVRDAIIQLEAEGLVVQRGQKGVLLRDPTPREFVEIYELRLVMEPFFAERAALLADPLQLSALRESCETLSSIARRPDLETWLLDANHCQMLYRLDMRFHSTIIAAAGNSIAGRIFSSAQVLAHTFAWGTAGRQGPPDNRLHATAREHQGIFEAISTRDPAASRERMRQHVLDAIPSVTGRYAETVKADREATEKEAAARAAAAVRGRR
jgi:DNA-binding GntR family transcriptional regulator